MRAPEREHARQRPRERPQPNSLALVPRRAQAPVELDDSELLARVITGDEAAWRCFFRRFRGLVAACVLKTGGRSGLRLSAEEMSDISQATWLRMVDRDFHRLRMYRPDANASVATWVGIIASSCTRDYLRRLRRERVESGVELELLSVESKEPSAAERLELIEEGLELERRVASLSARDREFVELYFRCGLAPAEVAEKMGISVRSVYTKTYKITAKLSSEPETSRPVSSTS